MEREPQLNQAENAPSNSLLRRGIAKAAIIGTLSAPIANYVGHEIGNFFGSIRPGQKITSEHIEAKRLKLVPMEPDCKALGVWDVNGSKIKVQATLGERQIPQVGEDITFEDPSRVALMTCAADTKTYLQNVAISDKEVNQSLGYYQQEVKIPIEHIVVNAQFPADNKKVVVEKYTGLQAIDAGAGGLSVAVAAACGISNPVDLAFNTGKCNDAKNSINKFITNLDAKNTATAESLVLRAIEREASKKDWANTKLAMIDAYKAKAVNEVGKPEAADLVTVVFVDANGNPTNDTPKFNKTIFDQFKGKELNAETDSASITPKITIKEPAPYVPKYFDPATGKSRTSSTEGQTQ